MPSVLLVDNYDSFTYNLYHLIEGLGANVKVVRNDEIDQIEIDSFDGIVFSPGPGLPDQAGEMMSLMKSQMGRKPILGVCLGMQCMAILLGGNLFNQTEVKHGVKSEIEISGGDLFLNIKSPTQVGLYHSWAVSNVGNYDVNALSGDGIVMAIENTDLKIYGVQFHPESIMTLEGRNMIFNFLNLL